MKAILTILLGCLAQLTFSQNLIFFDKEKIGSQSINALCQDNDNFLWIGTKHGLHRFDGTRFVSYFHDRQDSCSLKDNEVHSLYVDNRQTLWIGTASGLQRYLPESDNFQSVVLDNADTGGRITGILQCSDNTLLCNVSGTGIFQVDIKTMKAHPIMKDTYSPYILCMLEDNQKYLWIGTDRQGIIRTNPFTGEKKRYDLPLGNIETILKDTDGNIYIVLKQAIYIWNKEADQPVPLTYTGNRKEIVFDSAILTSDDNIVLGTYGQGLMYIAHGTTEIRDMNTLYSSFVNINKIKATALFEDRLKNLWIGCAYQGMLMLPHKDMPFHFYDLPITLSDTPGQINAIYNDRQNVLWCAIEDNGIFQFDSHGHVTRNIPTPGSVSSMYEDSEGTFWIGVNEKGLYIMDRKTGTLHLQYPVSGDFAIRTIAEDRHKNLYISILGKGILRYQLRTRKGELFSVGHPLPDKKNIYNNWIASILCDSKDRIWFGHYGYISCYDTKTRHFLDFPFKSDIQFTSCYSIIEGKNDTIWLGTRQGLVCYNSRTNKYSVWTTEQGLSDNIICGLIQDQQGNLWCSTTKGINFIDCKTWKVTNFYTGNGLHDKVYLEGRYSTDQNGRIYLGGEKGITSFQPKDIYQVTFDTAPFITDMYVYDRRINRQSLSGGHPVADKEPIRATDFQLAYSDNTFTFLVSMMNYRDAGNVFYEYRLKEFGDSWNRTQPGENRIQYHHLPSGNYTLEIRASENGCYSPVKSVGIHIASPWYFSPLARILYGLLLLGTCYLVYIAIRRRQREKTGEMKLQFFINIAHEIRSPLTLIVSPLEQLLKKNNDKETVKSLLTIRYNTNRILNLLNQLLDIRRIDKGQIHLQMAETDIQRFIKELLEMFSGQAQQQGIHLTAEFAENLPPVWIDPNHFDKVVINLLANALKYTPEGGDIRINVCTGNNPKATGPLRHYLEISVSDTGRGLNEKDLKRIFERFYQGDASQGSILPGFGIGLNLCQSLVKIHHGVIYAENRKDTQGSRFTIRLPLGCQHLRKEEMAAANQVVNTSVPSYLIQEENIVALEKTERSKTRYRVLAIDDDEALLRFLQENLSASYRVNTASNGTEGWQKAVTTLPDLIVSDVAMPGMDGIQLLKELKKNPNTNHIPVILLTSRTEFANRMEGLEQGADYYLSKPFNMEELQVSIANLITNRIRLKGKFSGNQMQEDKITSISLPDNDQLLMDKVMKVINENLSNPQLNVELLTQEVGISRSQLHRRLKEITGLPVSDFIRNLRIRQAVRLLKDKSLTVTQVAYAVGFTSQSHFSTIFKKLNGISPTEYKEAKTERQQEIDRQSDIDTINFPEKTK